MTFRQKSLADLNPQYSHYKEDNGPDLQVRSIFYFYKKRGIPCEEKIQKSGTLYLDLAKCASHGNFHSGSHYLCIPYGLKRGQQSWSDQGLRRIRKLP